MVGGFEGWSTCHVLVPVSFSFSILGFFPSLFALSFSFLLLPPQWLCLFFALDDIALYRASAWRCGMPSLVSVISWILRPSHFLEPYAPGLPLPPEACHSSGIFYPQMMAIKPLGLQALDSFPSKNLFSTSLHVPLLTLHNPQLLPKPSSWEAMFYVQGRLGESYLVGSWGIYLKIAFA